MTRPVRLQPLTQARVSALGEVGAAWLAELPGLLDELERHWSIRIGRTLPGGSSSYVAQVDGASGPAVLKLAVSNEGLDDQAATLRRADGRGYARLLAYDPGRRALLLEQLGDTLERSVRTRRSSWRSWPTPSCWPGRRPATGRHRGRTRPAACTP